MVTAKSQIRTVTKAPAKAPKKPSVAVDAKTGLQSGTSTFRQEAQGSVTVKGQDGSVTVARSTKPQVDLKQSSYNNMAQQQQQQASLTPQVQQQAQGQNPQALQASASQDFNTGGFGLASQPSQQVGLPSPQPAGNNNLQATPVGDVQSGQSGQAYGVDPNQSFISQTGQYQYPFFTSDGQKERLQNALATTNPFRMSSTLIGGDYRKGFSEATTALIWSVNAASAINAGAAVFNAVRAFHAAGSVAVVAGGAERLASTIPAATGVIAKTSPSTVGAAVNTANVANQIKALVNIPAVAKNAATLGGVISITTGIGWVGKAGDDKAKVKQKTVDYLKESGDLAVKLREVGLTDLADEIAAGNRDLEEGLKSALPFIPFFTKSAKESELQDYINRLNQINRSYDAKVKADHEREIAEAIAEEKQAAKEKEINDQLKLEEQRRYNEEQKQEQRRYNEQQTAENRAYQERQLQESRAYALGLDSASTQPADPSSLKFGLLHPSGATEFVDRDKAAQYYFSKSYTELTPAQQVLLNKLKEDK